LFTDEVVIVAAPAHAAARLDQLTFPMLMEHEWLLPSPQVLARTAFDAWCTQAGFRPSRLSNISGNSITLLPKALTATNAIAPVPASMVWSLIKEGALCQLGVNLQLPLPPLGGLYRKDDANPQIGKCLSILRRHCMREAT
jgi:DNA-binding transcriptional LysR family regulator